MVPQENAQVKHTTISLFLRGLNHVRVQIDCVTVDDVVVGPPETSTHGSTRPDLDPIPCETRLPEPRLASQVQYKRRWFMCLIVRLKYPADTFMSGVHVCAVIVWSRCVKIGQLCSAASASRFQTVSCCSFCERMREVGDAILQVALTHLRGVFVVRSVFLPPSLMEDLQKIPDGKRLVSNELFVCPGVSSQQQGLLVRQCFPLHGTGQAGQLQDPSLSKELSRIITSSGAVIRRLRDEAIQVNK